MRVTRLTIPGAYEDAWVYKDHLLAWTTSGDLICAPLGRLVELADEDSTDLGTIVSLLFTRNDWKASALFKRLTDIRDIDAIVDTLLASTAPDELTFDPESIFLDAAEDIVDGTVLNASIYADRVYTSTTSGFFDSDLSWDGGYLTLPLHSRQRLSHRTVSSSAGYGAVNASCENAGLFTGFDEFGWRGRGERVLEQTDDVSMGTSWLGESLVNYRGADARLLQGETERVDSNRDRTRRRLVVEYGSPWDLLPFLRDELVRRNQVELDEVELTRLVANVGAKVVVEVGAHRTVLAQLVGATEEAPRLQSIKTLPVADESVLSVAKLGAGIVLEAETSVLLWRDDGITELLPLPAVRVRSFPNSIRYRDTLLVVAEDAMYLIGTYDSAVDLPRNRRRDGRRRSVD